MAGCYTGVFCGEPSYSSTLKCGRGTVSLGAWTRTRTRQDNDKTTLAIGLWRAWQAYSVDNIPVQQSSLTFQSNNPVPCSSGESSPAIRDTQYNNSITYECMETYGLNIYACMPQYSGRCIHLMCQING